MVEVHEHTDEVVYRRPDQSAWFIPILLIFVLLLVLLLLGLGLYNNMNNGRTILNREIIREPITGSQPSPSPMPTTTLAPTATPAPTGISPTGATPATVSVTIAL